ncbi:YdhR family protein [Variovorax paradoxus]|uniref:YdhR family protein n=1 Tax=Variovorax paradoxus TaxID=34073 RepID=UPI003D656E0E
MMEHLHQLIHISFSHAGPWGAEMAKTFEMHGDRWLAQGPGLLWKVWTQNRYAGRVGATCLFNSDSAANNYLNDQLPKLEVFGLNEPRVERYTCI